MAANIIETLRKEEADRLLAARKVPEFRPGDTVRVNVRVRDSAGQTVVLPFTYLFVPPFRVHQVIVVPLAEQPVGSVSVTEDEDPVGVPDPDADIDEAPVAVVVENCRPGRSNWSLRNASTSIMLARSTASRQADGRTWAKAEASVAGVPGIKAPVFSPPQFFAANCGGCHTLAQAGTQIMAHENCRKRLSTDQFIEALDMKVPASAATAWPRVTFASFPSVIASDRRSPAARA